MKGGYDGGVRPPAPAPLWVRGGREGDDACVSIAVGDVVTPEMLRSLQDVLDGEAWAFEDMSDHYHPHLRPGSEGGK